MEFFTRIESSTRYLGPDLCLSTSGHSFDSWIAGGSKVIAGGSREIAGGSREIAGGSRLIAGGC